MSKRMKTFTWFIYENLSLGLSMLRLTLPSRYWPLTGSSTGFEQLLMCDIFCLAAAL
jgi:hypothetical protein